MIAEAIRKVGNANDTEALVKALEGMKMALARRPARVSHPTSIPKTHQIVQVQAIGTTVKNDKYPPAKYMLGNWKIYPADKLWPNIGVCRIPDQVKGKPDPSNADQRTTGLAMDISTLLSQFVSGLSVAMLIFLVASGLTLIFGVVNVLNFAHGSFYLLGTYFAFQAHAVVQQLLAGPAGRYPWGGDRRDDHRVPFPEAHLRAGR